MFPHNLLRFSCLLGSILVASGAQSASAQQATMQAQIVADGMCCNGCAQKIAAQLYAAPGVTNVQADVPSHTLTVTFRPSPKLTFGGIWGAVERGDGKPSRLTVAQTTYTLQRPEQLKLDQPLQPGQYWVVVEKLKSDQDTALLTKQLSSIRGVKSVKFDASSKTFFVETSPTDILSPFTAQTVVSETGHSMVTITGPYGVFAVERGAQQANRSTASQQPQVQGTIR